MNYLKYYFSIIAKAAGRQPSILYDKHHIIPQGLGGPDIEPNWIYLTPKEHVVAHHLLAKAYPNEEKLQSGFNVKSLKTFDTYRYMMRIKDLANSLEYTKRKDEILNQIIFLSNIVKELDITKVAVRPQPKSKKKKKE